jgi:hypothetical protein
MRNRRVIWLAALLITICAVVLVSAIVVMAVGNDKDRRAYQEINVQERTDFLTRFEEARQQGEEWVKNPEAVALEFACGGGCDEARHFVQVNGPEERVVWVEQEAFDDSIEAYRTRVDLKRASDGAWQVEWAGEQWKCHSYRVGWEGIFQGYFGWHTRLCP